MANLKETSQAYEPKRTLNIADLEEVPLDIPISKVSGTNQEGKNFEYHVAELDGEKYRVPVTVLESIKTILEQKPELKTVKVVKKGSGMGTEYTVIPLE